MATVPGSNVKITYTVYKPDGVTPQPLTDYAGWTLTLYQGSTILQRYASAAATGFDHTSVTVISPAGGEIEVLVLATITAKLKPGPYHLEFEGQRTDAAADEGRFREKAPGVKIDDAVESPVGKSPVVG